jgi:hypothetical protein
MDAGARPQDRQADWLQKYKRIPLPDLRASFDLPASIGNI